MHIAIAAPIAGDDVRAFLDANSGAIPCGYLGAPLTGILIGELLRLGHRVTAVTTDSTLSIRQGPVRCEGPNFSFVACPARPKALRPNGLMLGRAADLFWFERRGVREALIAAAPDIVHAHWSYEFALAAIAQPAPHLITCHDSPAVVLRFNRSVYRALRYVMARQVFSKGREFSTVSDYMARELAPWLRSGVPEVIPNPVAAQVFALGRPRHASGSRRVAMVCNGWDSRKNPEPALRAFALWRASEPVAELHLFGADFGSGELAQRWAQAEGLTAGVHFHGRLPHHALVRAMAETDALLHPALEESFGVVLAEAMALGLPVIAGVRSGAVPWVLGADSSGQSAAGLLVDVRDIAKVADALRALFGAGYAERSVAGMQLARTAYSAVAVAGAYLRRYETILATEWAPTETGPSAAGVKGRPCSD